MNYTSAQAAKLLKRIENRIETICVKESKSALFNASVGEDVEELRPEYDFAATQKELEDLKEKARKVKHAINVFNIEHTLPGFDNMTIDQALVYLPQLNASMKKYRRMSEALSRERVEGTYRRSSIVDYIITNYDIAEAEQAYREVSDKLARLQLALDEANRTETMEIDITLD